MLLGNLKKLSIHIQFLVICILILLDILPVIACKYNVRETGFVDLESRFYSLYICVDKSVDELQRTKLSQSARLGLEDSNVHYQVIDVEKRTDHPAIQFLKKSETSFPISVLLSPDGQALSIPTSNFNAELLKIVSSPKRQEIAEKTIKNYSVLLLVEGVEERENKRAMEIAIAAAKHVGEKMDMMPKPIKHPPVIISIKQSEFVQEKAILWSLGLDTTQIIDPQVAIIYGKARWLGPLVSGEHLTKTNLVDLLLVIGADCECGLDKSWLQGTMLPIKWHMPLQKQVMANLGFDAENPYVRMEMMAIMRNTMVAPGTIPLHAFPDMSVQLDTLVTTNIPQYEKADVLTETAEQSPIHKSIQLVLLLLILVLIGGVVLVVFKMRNNNRI